MAGRKKAPNVKLNADHRDMRTEILAELNKAHPEFVHAFQDIRANSDEMAIKEQEWVRENTYDSDGTSDIKQWRRDGIMRTPKAYADELRRVRTEASAETVESTYCDKSNNDEWEKNTTGKRVRSPKSPSQIGNNGGM
jgi:hypothetical protein